MNPWENYYRAQSILDALETLNKVSGSGCVLAGGTDLLLDIQQGRHAAPAVLVDITSIPEMRVIEFREDSLFIGAAVPINQIVRSSIINQHAQALVEACDLIGGPQVRNVATLGGNVAHALPAADGTIALVALDAVAEVASLQGTRQMPVLDLFLGPGKSSLIPERELLVGFYLPLREKNQASSFKRVMRPQGVALPILNTACWCHRGEDRLVDVRLSIGPSGPTPRRLRSAEEILRGQPLSRSRVEQAIEAILAESSFRSSRFRATKEYRHHLVRVLLTDVLEIAWQRAASDA